MGVQHLPKSTVSFTLPTINTSSIIETTVPMKKPRMSITASNKQEIHGSLSSEDYSLFSVLNPDEYLKKNQG